MKIRINKQLNIFDFVYTMLLSLKKYNKLSFVRKITIFLIIFLTHFFVSFSQEIERIKSSEINNRPELQDNVIGIKKRAVLEVGKSSIEKAAVDDSLNNRSIIQPSVSSLQIDRPVKSKESKIELKRSEIDPSNNNRGLLAAPANDLPCNAEALDISSATDCYTQTAGNSEATLDYYGGCVQPNHASVWYTFDISGINDYLNVTITAPDGKEMEAMIVQGTCTGSPDGYFVGEPTVIQSHCALSPFDFEFYDLANGTYYLMFSTQPGSNVISTDFDICFTQSEAPEYVTGPEQDCAGAISVCDMIYDQNNSYVDYWLTDEIPTGTTCLYGGEHNSVWYTFTPQTSGDFAFTLETTYDYDWAIYDLDDIGGCANISTSTPVLCNYSADYGNTGATLPVNATIPRSEGALGSATMAGIPVVAGTNYALIVDNYTGGGTGYRLDFSSSTASIADDLPNPPGTGAAPEMSSAVGSCTANTITIDLSEHVQCITIVPGDFILTNTTTSTDFTSAIEYVTGLNCATNELTSQLIITHDGSLTTGVYEIEIDVSPTLADKCGNIIVAGGTVTFNHLGDLTLTASDPTICEGESISLNADGADGTPSVLTYTLNPGGATNTTDGVFTSISPTITTVYTVSGTYGGCTGTASATVTVEGNIITSITPSYKSLCAAGTTDISASTTINGTSCTTCTYAWSTPPGGSGTTVAGVSTVNVGAGTYTVTVTTANGCTNDNSPSSTIVVVGAGTGGGSCDVIYVSPAGGGDGYTKEAPTDLADAISKAQCTNTVIKMQQGIYTFTTYMNIYDYVTIEGGFNSDFTLKSSDLSGGVNSTTIRRQNNNDGGADTDKCSAFVAAAGVSDFRIQDIRIEMPGSTNVTGHAASSGVANYGIRLGSGCANYNIVRCYIDAGVGANP